ncbi:MAG: magnesium transporter [Acidimicrobiales bacterium]
MAIVWGRLGVLFARRLRLLARARFVLGPSPADTRQSLVALGLGTMTSLVAGVALGLMTDTLSEMPGLLLLVPAAIGMRGNIFGALGSRLSTSIHMGTFGLSRRVDTVVGQNILASMVLTLSVSLSLAGLAKLVAVAFSLPGSISFWELVLISVVGGVISSLVVLVATLGLAAGSTRFGWDLDNVAAPLVSAIGDVIGLPSLWLATLLVISSSASMAMGLVLTFICLAALIMTMRSGLVDLIVIVRESLPILMVAGMVSLVAGIVIEKRLDSFTAFPALLVLLPGFLSSAGALGGTLSSRLATKLHLGLAEPSAVPSMASRLDISLIAILSVPVFLGNALVAELAAGLLGVRSPGLSNMVGVAMFGGMLAMVFVVFIAYYGTLVAVRLGVDPDNYGIPLVSSSVDLVGAFAIILVVVALGIT